MGVKVRIRFDKLNFDGPGFKKATLKVLREEIVEACRIFVQTAYPHVPVYTGMARAAFVSAAGQLNMVIPISPVPGALEKHPERGIEAGISLGTFTIDFSATNLLRVSLNIEVPGYAYGEQHGSLTQPIPWESMEYGREAFRRYLRANLTARIPSISSFITRTRVEVT